MDRKQGLELFNLFFRLPDERFWPGITYMVPTSDGKALDLLKMGTAVTAAGGMYGDLEEMISFVSGEAYMDISKILSPGFGEMYRDLEEMLSRGSVEEYRDLEEMLSRGSVEEYRDLKEMISTGPGPGLLAHILANNLNSQRVYGLLAVIWRMKIRKDENLSPFPIDTSEDIGELIEFLFSLYSLDLSPRERESGCPAPNRMSFYEETLDFLRDKGMLDPLKVKGILLHVMDTNDTYALYLEERDMALESLAGKHEFDGETLWKDQADANASLIIQSLREQLLPVLGMSQDNQVAEPPNLEFWEEIALTAPALMRKSADHEETYVNLCKGTRAFKDSLKTQMKTDLTKKGASALHVDDLFPTAKTLHAKVWRSDKAQYGKTAFKDT